MASKKYIIILLLLITFLKIQGEEMNFVKKSFDSLSEFGLKESASLVKEKLKSNGFEVLDLGIVKGGSRRAELKANR